MGTLCNINTELTAAPDFTKCNMFLDQYLCWSWNNIPINQSDFRDTFMSNLCLQQGFYTSVIDLSFLFCM